MKKLLIKLWTDPQALSVAVGVVLTVLVGGVPLGLVPEVVGQWAGLALGVLAGLGLIKVGAPVVKAAKPTRKKQ